MTSNKRNKDNREFKLDDIQPKAKYHAPEGYFNDLKEQITAEISEEKLTKSSKSFKQHYWWAAASILLVSFSFFYFFTSENNSREVSQLLAEVNDEAIIAYLVDSEIDEFEINQWTNGALNGFGSISEMEMTDEEAREIKELYAL